MLLNLEPRYLSPYKLFFNLVLEMDKWDEDSSEWSVQNTPVFGSPEDDDDASDYLRDAMWAAYFITRLATSNGDDPRQ